MKRLKNLSLFRIAIFFALNIYLFNIYVFLISLIYLFFKDKLETLIFIILLILNVLLSYFINDFVKIGYVENVKTNYVVVNKILYKEKVYDTDVYYGDIVITNSSFKSEDESLIKKNIKYISYDSLNIFKTNTLLSKIYKLINDSDDEVKNLYKKIILNEYVNDLDLDYYIGYGLCAYYLLKKISDKNKYIGLLSLFVYSILFGFEIKFL